MYLGLICQKIMTLEKGDIIATGTPEGVALNDPTASLQADKIDYDFETKHFKVSMFDDDAVSMKVIK